MLVKQWVVLGDFNQFPPIANQWLGTPVAEDAMEASSFLRELCPRRSKQPTSKANQVALPLQIKFGDFFGHINIDHLIDPGDLRRTFGTDIIVNST